MLSVEFFLTNQRFFCPATQWQKLSPRDNRPQLFKHNVQCYSIFSSVKREKFEKAKQSINFKAKFATFTVESLRDLILLTPC